MAGLGAGKPMASLYANLLEPNSSTNNASQNASTSSTLSTISRAPVVFTQAVSTSATSKDAQAEANASTKKQISAAALRFQPLARRPQAAQAKTTKKSNAGGVGIAGFVKIAKAESNTNTDDISQAKSDDAPTVARAPVVKSTLEDWATNPEDDDVNGFYGSNNRQRGGRKRRKKNKEKEEKVYYNWDDIYDPSRPNSYEEYRESDEKEQEMRDWRDRLYGRRAFSSDEEEDEKPSAPSRAFAPPSSYSFAPPPVDGTPDKLSSEASNLDAEDPYTRRLRLTQTLSGQDDAYSQPQATASPPSPPPSFNQYPPPPPPPPSSFAQISPPPPAPSAVPISSSTISKAPIRYTLPAAPVNLPTSLEEDNDEDSDSQTDGYPPQDQEEDQPRTNRPGQKGFAERLMSKYGWTKGSGLGADSSGIVQALHVKVAKGKDKKKGTGQIIDRNKKRIAQDGKYGKMSEVVVLKRMVDGLEGEDTGTLMQEIGDECAEKYGRIERVFIKHRQSEDEPSKVFVQFTSELSSLRAVNALDGRLFNGNTIEARYFDATKFENRELDE